MEPTRLVLDAVMAIATAFTQKGIEITLDKAKEIIGEICKKNPTLRGQIDMDDMAKKIQATAGNVGRFAYNEETLARFLEVPIPDLATVTPDNLDMGTLYNHIKLENEFQEWLKELEMIKHETLRMRRAYNFGKDGLKKQLQFLKTTP